MSPRAVGVRTPYAMVPEPVRAWVELTLGSPVVGTHEQVGGMSPGCATRLVCADGTRAFVKAVGAELNPNTPTLFRREVQALTLLGSHPLWAELLAAYDDGDWVALLLEDVDGVHPDLADDRVMAQLCDAVDRLGEVLTERVPEPPTAPTPERGGLTDLCETYRRWAHALDDLDVVPDDLLPRWVRDRAVDLGAGVLALADLPTDTLVHFDVRDDNLLVRPTGEIVFLDWGACGRGQDWLDPMLARWERVDDPWFDASLASSPALLRAGDSAVTSAVVGFGVYLTWRVATAVDENLPTLQAFRRRESRRFRGATARRHAIST